MNTCNLTISLKNNNISLVNKWTHVHTIFAPMCTCFYISCKRVFYARITKVVFKYEHIPVSTFSQLKQTCTRFLLYQTLWPWVVTQKNPPRPIDLANISISTILIEGNYPQEDQGGTPPPPPKGPRNFDMLCPKC